jgi:hypothetical protein
MTVQHPTSAVGTAKEIDMTFPLMMEAAMATAGTRDSSLAASVASDS